MEGEAAGSAEGDNNTSLRGKDLELNLEQRVPHAGVFQPVFHPNKNDMCLSSNPRWYTQVGTIRFW